jgi:hypothetical protein
MKQQILQFKKEGISSYDSIKNDILEKLDDNSKAYINSIAESAKASYGWNDSEKRLYVSRTWNDEDYNDYIENWTSPKDVFKFKLAASGYEFTETVEDI